ncbi:hypothetical protein EMCRGX_G019626 [Ephydatia muelleri]
MKRIRSEGIDELEESEVKRRTVSHGTFLKWQKELDKEFKMLTWLQCEVGGKNVTALKCSTCATFEKNITGRRNFSDKWIIGAESVRVSNIKDHAGTDQHKHAMILLTKQQAQARGEGPSTYAPIAKALHEIPDDGMAKLRVKFDIAHFIAVEKLSFSKYPALCELETRQGVKVGTEYTNVKAAKEFCHYIAESRMEELKKQLEQAKFFSILMDGSTDSGNIDDELFLAVFCDVDGMDERFHTRMKFLAVERPNDATASGLFQCLQCCLHKIGVKAIDAEECKRLVGIGTDSTNTNIASAGLKGLVESHVPWVFWMWCLAHRVELAIKDALKSTTFDLIDEMLLRMYYIYEKSPKKCRELENIITDLKEFLKLDDAGIRPVRASGTRSPFAMFSLTNLLRTVKEVDKLSSCGLERWPTYAATLAKITEEDGKRVYQLQELKCFAQAKEHFTANFNEFCASVTTCFRTRLAWSDLQLIRDIIFVMETQGWQKILDDKSEVGIGSEDISLPVTRLAEIFRVPLEAAVSTLGYQAVWWRLFHAPNCNDWPNLLLLVRMIFTLPVSNGKLERVFSTMKLLKVEKRSQMGNDTLDDLLAINIDRVPLNEFNPDPCINRWWDAKHRRPIQKPRKPYKTGSSDKDKEAIDVSSSDDETFMLDDWDDFTTMADETTDAANIEQVVIYLRWVSETLAVHEDFIGLYELASTGAETIYFTIKDVLLRLNLPISKVRGQCYDGAATMAGFPWLYSFYAKLTTSASRCKQKDMSAAEGQIVAAMTNSTLKAMRNDDGFWQRVTTMAKNVEIPDPELPLRRKSARRHDDECAPDFPLTGYKMYEKVEMLLLKAAASKPYVQELKHVLTSYGDDFDPLQLSTQLEVLSNYFSSKDKVFYLILLNSSKPAVLANWSFCHSYGSNQLVPENCESDESLIAVNTNELLRGKFGALVESPLTKFKRALETLASHDKTEYHKDSYAKMVAFLESASKVDFCGRQGIALRGQRDDAKYLEDTDLNPDNYQALLKFRCDAGDTVLAEHLSKCAKKATYCSKMTQNDIIDILGGMITEKVISRVNEAKLFSVISDEVQDVASIEQLTFVLRSVHQEGESYVVKESFAGFKKQHREMTGEAVASTILQKLDELGLNCENLRGQGYDGSGFMAGIRKGRMALVQDVQGQLKELREELDDWNKIWFQLAVESSEEEMEDRFSQMRK